jgi:hypothetical protein
MRKSGIWLDKEKALCFVLEESKEIFKSVDSGVEFFNPKGGSRSKTRWGPQDVVQDSKYLEREKHQMRRYFENIVSALGEVDALAIYGPAETPEKFLKLLRKNNTQLAKKVKIVERADSMTDNQFKAMVRDFFKKVQT